MSPDRTPDRPAPVPTTTGGTLGDTTDLSLWSWWWEFNKEPFLELRAHLESEPSSTGSDGYYLGHGYRSSRPNIIGRPTEADVNERIVPALRRALASAQSNDVVTATLVALARIGGDYGAADRAALDAELRPYLSDANQEVVETATVCLGILGNESSAIFLGELLLDTRTGRPAVGRGRVSLRTRVFAAYALGLLGARTRREDVRRYVVHKLVAALQADETPGPDLGVACVLAIGRVPLEWAREPLRESGTPAAATSSREAEIATILSILEDSRSRRVVRAHAPIALAGLLTSGPEAAPELLRERVGGVILELFEGKNHRSRDLRQSSAIALGMLGDDDGDPIDRAIRSGLVRASGDRYTRYLALLSLGRVSGRPGPGPPVALDSERRRLLAGLARAGAESRWSALGLALMERGRVAAGRDASPDVRAALLRRLAEVSSPTDVGALAIASGILGDAAAAEPLVEKLGSLREDEARGFTALALGMIQAREARADVRALVEGATHRPVLLRESALALGLLGDRGTTEFLVGRLQTSRSLAAQAALAQALGRIGDRRAVDPLLALLADEEHAPLTRAFAAVALGLVTDADQLPWNTLYSVDVHYAGAPSTLYDRVGFGLLNIL
jgi:HEAT repeat protein